MRKISILFAIAFVFWSSAGWTQAKGPRLPTSGIKGAAGVGFVDFTTRSPSEGFKLDRGTYVAGAIERPFNVMNLHLVLSIANMTASGEADYRYTKDSTTFSANSVGFKASMFDLGLGVKLKLIEDFWFRPYVGGGGLGGYHEISYTSTSALASQGTGYKTKDTVMGAGYYGEVGLEVEFTSRFGVQLAGRLSDYSSKPLETLGGQKLKYRSETYYFSALIGF